MAMSRLYRKILSDLIEKEYNNFEEEEQSGFRAGGYRQHILFKRDN